MIDGKFMWEMMYPEPPYFISNINYVNLVRGGTKRNVWGGASLISTPAPEPNKPYYWKFYRSSNGKCKCSYSTNGENW